MIVWNNIVISTLVLSCVVLVQCRVVPRQYVPPSTVGVGRYVDDDDQETTLNLHTKLKLMIDPARDGKAAKVRSFKTYSTVDAPAGSEYRRSDDDNDVDDEGGDDSDNEISVINGGGLWDEDFGSGSGSGSDSDDLPRPTPQPNRPTIPKPRRVGPPVDTPKETPAVAIRTSCGNNIDDLCTEENDTDDDIFGKAKSDWIEGDDSDLGDAIFGKVNSTWTWGKMPVRAHDTAGAVDVGAVRLTGAEELQVKEAVVQALKWLSATPCTGPRREDAKCKTLQGVVRELTLLGLVFTSERP